MLWSGGNSAISGSGKLEMSREFMKGGGFAVGTDSGARERGKAAVSVAAGCQGVVRLLQILQDRPVEALRLSDVGDMAAANAFLRGDLACHNARLAVMPEDEADAHVPCAGEVTGLARSRTLHHCYKLSRDLLLSFNRQRCIVQTGGQSRHALRGETVTVMTEIFPLVRLPCHSPRTRTRITCGVA